MYQSLRSETRFFNQVRVKPSLKHNKLVTGNIHTLEWTRVTLCDILNYKYHWNFKSKWLQNHGTLQKFKITHITSYGCKQPWVKQVDRYSSLTLSSAQYSDVINAWRWITCNSTVYSMAGLWQEGRYYWSHRAHHDVTVMVTRKFHESRSKLRKKSGQTWVDAMPADGLYNGKSLKSVLLTCEDCYHLR